MSRRQPVMLVAQCDSAATVRALAHDRAVRLAAAAVLVIPHALGTARGEGVSAAMSAVSRPSLPDW